MHGTYRCFTSIKCVILVKAWLGLQSWKPLTTNPPYGYLKDKEDKNKWIVDEVVAKTVKLIFNLCIKGFGPSQIASELKSRKIPTPAEYFSNLGINFHLKNPR